MLDEVDKMGADVRGDPTAALLEVLDPAQNSTFVDHYLEVPFDLSGVMFIATANSTVPIPDPLLDRMEQLTLVGCTPSEKLQIAKRYLLPRQMKETGLGKGKEAERAHYRRRRPRAADRRYTREAGVRQLEREIQGILRKAAWRSSREVDECEDLVEESGEVRRSAEGAERSGRSSAGDRRGDRARVDARRRRHHVHRGDPDARQRSDHIDRPARRRDEGIGPGRLEPAARPRRRARIPLDAFTQSDVHLHVPAGGFHKDGPSAGITIAAALASLFTRRPSRHDVAMTGELTLRGRVLPIGGLRRS